MKIIDSNGVEIANPDLTLGYLKPETQTIHHDTVAGVEEVSHYETICEYPNGGKDVKKIVDVKSVPAQDAYDEKVEVQRYVLYTAEELAAQEKAHREAQQRQEALDKLPETLAALKNENEMLKQCLLEMSETVYA